jgi:uncharacterized protein YfaS (alpha-2-macroglobulin family)
MRIPGVIAAVTMGGFAASQSPTLTVLRTGPGERAQPTAAVTVTFDRPVAGQLDATADPRTIFSIAPAVAGRLEWRDPVTIRFTPAAPLSSGTTYTVTIANNFASMDGARLAEPYRFAFRVAGPRPLVGSPAGPWGTARHLTPTTGFEVLFSGEVDPVQLARLARLHFDADCRGPGSIALSVTGQRPPSNRDPSHYQYEFGGHDNPRAVTLRRVVTLRPARPLPADCAGRLMLPSAVDTANPGEMLAWALATHGPLRLDSVTCTNRRSCPAGYAQLHFRTPVRGSEVLRHVRISPAADWTVGDTAAEQDRWMLEGALRTRTTYTIAIDSALRDIFGQPISGPRTGRFATTGYASDIEYSGGRLLVERESFRTMAVRHVNVDTLFVSTVAVPESLEARVLAAPRWNMDAVWPLLAPAAVVRAVRVSASADTPLVSAVRLPVYNAGRPGAATLTVLRITANRIDRSRHSGGALTLAQVTNLGLAARLGAEEAVVWVTTLNDGAARPGAAVTLHGHDGRVRATGTTDARGLVRLTGLAPDTGSGSRGGFRGYVSARWESDRAVVPLDSYSWELSPWRFNVAAASNDERIPAAAAVYTERGIYRPGETVHAAAIVRTGALGSLSAPARGDSVRWLFSGREDVSMRDTTIAPSSFGTATQTMTLPAGALPGTYAVKVMLKREGRWVELASTAYRVAEYRPPEFLVSVLADTARLAAGDTLRTLVEARYLFGAPMSRTPVSWSLRRAVMWPWELSIPGTADYYIGETGFWWESDEAENPGTETVASGTDTLDATGRARIRAAIGAPQRGRPARLTFLATVTDVNRQAVVSAASATVHPAAIYVGARPAGSWFWTAGTPVSIDLLAVRPGGERVPGVAVRGTVVRREWHVVQRRREGVDQRVGEWVSDTVAQCNATSATAPVPCSFTPRAAGSYIVTFRAADGSGREAVTSFYRWAAGRDWVPWDDESQLKMDVMPDRTRYDVGDTATVLLASPFTGAEAWISIEREGIIEQRRLRLESGATTVRIALTEAHVPNAYVSVVVVRGRSAPAGSLTDPGRPALRVGYAELNVTPSVKRLSVEVRPLAAEYRPGDTARVQVRVRDSGGTGRRSEVTLWAVDEGVLALTGYRTPDVVGLIYRPRGLGMTLASNMINVAAQIAEQEGIALKGDRAPGGGGGLEGGDILRSRFASTAFFLGSVLTDEAGVATAAARLPDNLTTFRVMAVAVTPGDRYGSGESSILVTRPLLARPALPRFLRPTDRFSAGVVVHRRGGPAAARVAANSRGAILTSPALRPVTLPAGRGTEVRFAFTATGADSAAFRFDVSNGRDSDAVLTRMPVRPAFVPRAHTAGGTVGITTAVELPLPAEIDPARSRMVFSVGTTPLALIGGMARLMQLYPFDCTEQIVDVMLPLIALIRAGPEGARLAPADARSRIASAVEVLALRQQPDGSIGLWSANSWSTPWLTAYAGEALLAARAAGLAVNDTLLSRIGDYLERSWKNPRTAHGPVTPWLAPAHVNLAENVAAADFLSRAGRADPARENALLRLAPQMAWEDRARLAEMFARRRDMNAARQLLGPLWSSVQVEGRRAVLPNAAQREFYFRSGLRPAARLLRATLAVDSGHALIAALVETVVESGRTSRWNTQDYGAAVEALAAFTTRQRLAARRGYTVAGSGRVLIRSTGAADAPLEHTVPLTGLLAGAPGAPQRLALSVTAPAASAATPLYFWITVHEVPRAAPVRPDQQGVQVERWYEDATTGQPIISVAEGSLVRVRLRVTVTAERRFLALTDPLPAGLEAVDLSLRTEGAGPGAAARQFEDGEQVEGGWRGWSYGWWDSGWWSPFDHRELRDDRVAYVATVLWPGTYTATYVARATTPGVFVRPPAHAEEMYNPAVQGRSDGGTFTVTRRAP